MSIALLSAGRRISTQNIGLHPEAVVWARRVLANSGSASAFTLAAVSSFCSAIDAAGIRDRFYRLNLFCGDNLAACLVPLYRGPSPAATQLGSTTDTNVNFVAGDYSESQGITATSAGKVLNTGLTSSSMPSNAGHAAWSIRNGSFLASGFLFGFNNNGSYRTYNFISNASSQNVGCASGNFNETSSTASAYARWVTSRTSLSSHVLYRNASAVNTSTATVTATTGSTDQFSVFGFNGSASARSGLHYYSLGDGMTAAQVNSFDTALQAFLAAMGRS